MHKHLINVQQLHAWYGTSHVLQGIDFSLATGETLGLMGRNGMGKSTLLKSIMGLIAPPLGKVTGDIHIMGHNARHIPTHAIAQMGVAYVPEGRGIFGNLSVRENLIMAARSGATDLAKARAKRGEHWDLTRVLETFPRLKERLNHGGQQLSGGEQQMLTIGRALMTNPDVLILDEATEGLAPLIAREIWRICHIIRASGVSSIIVDKNWQQLTQITTRNVILIKGQVVFDGPTAQLQAHPERLQQYLGV